MYCLSNNNSHNYKHIESKPCNNTATVSDDQPWIKLEVRDSGFELIIFYWLLVKQMVVFIASMDGPRRSVAMYYVL